MNQRDLQVSKDKESILKATREKQLIMYKSSSVRLLADLLSETLETERQQAGIFRELKENTKPKVQYPAKLFFKSKGEIKTFSDKPKLREFNT